MLKRSLLEPVIKGSFYKSRGGGSDQIQFKIWMAILQDVDPHQMSLSQPLEQLREASAEMQGQAFGQSCQHCKKDVLAKLKLGASTDDDAFFDACREHVGIVQRNIQQLHVVAYAAITN